MPKAAPAAPPQIASISSVISPELHGSGPAVNAAAAKLFGEHLSEVEEQPEVEAAPAPEGAEVEETEEVESAPAEPELEGEEAADEPLDYEALTQIATKRAAERAAKTQESSLESEAAAFRRLRDLAQTGGPQALLQALGVDPTSLAPAAQRPPGTEPTPEDLQAKIASLEATVLELREGVTEQFTQVEQSRAAQQNRREFVALTEDKTNFPLLAAKDAKTRLAYTADAVRVLQGAAKAVTHANVARVIESKLRAEFESTARALGLAIPTSPSSTTTRASKKTTPTLNASLAAEPAAGRPKSERERNRAADALVTRIFGAPSSATP